MFFYFIFVIEGTVLVKHCSVHYLSFNNQSSDYSNFSTTQCLKMMSKMLLSIVAPATVEGAQVNTVCV